MSISAETWAATADGVQQIVADIDAGELHATPERRAFLASIAKGMQGAAKEDPESKTCPPLCESAIEALRHHVDDIRERLNNGTLAASDRDRECLNRYADHLAESHISGGFSVDITDGDLDGGPASPVLKEKSFFEPETVGLAVQSDTHLDGGGPDSTEPPATITDGGTP